MASCPINLPASSRSDTLSVEHAATEVNGDREGSDERPITDLFFEFRPVENGSNMQGPRQPAGLSSMNVHAG